jgi:CRP-like cAMP-binding protein
MYLQEGAVKLSVSSSAGKQAIVAILRPGHFFGETALTGQPCPATAIVMTASRVLIIPKERITQLLRTERAFVDCFIAHILARSIRLEEELVDQLFHSCEQRLARLLLRLANGGESSGPRPVPLTLSQSTLAEIIGATRPRVNFCLSKFRRLGFIEGGGRSRLVVHESLESVLADDEPVGIAAPHMSAKRPPKAA